MKIPPRNFSTATRIVCVISLLLLPLFEVLQFDTAHAAQITARTLALEESATAAANDKLSYSAPSITGHAGADQYVGMADHHFTFTVTTTAGINSISVQYCTTATGTCNAPGDLDASDTISDLEAGSTNLGATPSYVSTAVNRGYVTFTAPLGGTAINFTLDDVYNPSASNTTFYARIVTYTSADATTGSTDTGVVAASTTQPIILTGIMPESLVFCTGGSIGVQGAGSTSNHTDGSLPDCGTATGGSVSFNAEFSPTTTRYATSMMAASTNAGSGYVITVNGNTLESGANSIPAMAAAAASTTGVSQFGMNLMDNATPNIGNDIDDTSNGALYLEGSPQAGYNTADTFKFVSGDIVAASDFTTPSTRVPSDAQLYTTSYIVNVRGSQIPGTYTTTLIYVCTATY